MSEQELLLRQLLEELSRLKEKQQHFEREILSLQASIYALKANIDPVQPPPGIRADPADHSAQATATVKRKEAPSLLNAKKRVQVITGKGQAKAGWEKYVGQQLISRIGMLITIIGVAIGVKYSIEHELLSPLTRVILGYLLGIGLAGLALFLKKKYTGYSAVLISGAFATLYMVTFAAFSYYQFFSPGFSFFLLLIITLTTVVTALWYDQQIIAIIGLVGAYAIPFLVSSGQGNSLLFLTYIALINAGVLFMSFRKYWKSLFYAAFITTWLVFSSWYFLSANPADHGIALFFATIFFLSFYACFLAYHVIRKQLLPIESVTVLLSNNFIFYGLGLSILSDMSHGDTPLFIFTLVLAGIQGLVAFALPYWKTGDRTLKFVLTGLALLFITLAIPIQWDGNWVTFCWTGEALLMFWAGRNMNRSAYERVGLILLMLAGGSLLQDWFFRFAFYDAYSQFPFLNIHFFSSLFYFISLGILNWLQLKKPMAADQLVPTQWRPLYDWVLPGLLLLMPFVGVALEIHYTGYYRNRQLSGQLHDNSNYLATLARRTDIWVLMFAFVYTFAVGMINKYLVRNKFLQTVQTAGLLVAAVAFWATGIPALQALENIARHSGRGFLSFPDLLIYHYLFFGCAALLLFSSTRHVLFNSENPITSNVRQLFIHLLLLSMLTREVSYWMTAAGGAPYLPIAVSITWALYAAGLIGWGLRKDDRFQRIAGMLLFALTLLKLLFIDLAMLSTLAKTLIFLSLGALMLGISFLYNRIKTPDTTGED